MIARLNKRLGEGRNESGFTLIELLIVIIILGVLAAIVVFAVGGTRKDSVANSCKTDYKSIELSAEAINTKKGGYPTGAVTDATADTSNPLTTANTSTATTANGKDNGALLKAYPKSGDYKLNYSGAADGKTFTITVQKKQADGSFANVATDATAVTGCEYLS